MLRAPPISWLTICPLGQPEKAIGLEPQIEPWLAIFATRTACRIRNRRRRHDSNMTLRKKRTPRASLHYMGWRDWQKSLLLPVAGELFLLTLPFIERGNRSCQVLAAFGTKIARHPPASAPHFHPLAKRKRKLTRRGFHNNGRGVCPCYRMA